MFQPSFAAEDVPYRSLPTMSKDILQAMMPGVHIYEADMTEGGRLVQRKLEREQRKLEREQRKLEREQRKLKRDKPAGASSD
jgi:hypothetical protein